MRAMLKRYDAAAFAGVLAATAALTARPAATKTATAFLSDCGVSESFMQAPLRRKMSFRENSNAIKVNNL